MTSPVSAIEAIEKYIEMRLEAHASECDDPTWPVPHDVQVMRDAKSVILAAARQAEALQRENAEKDARIAALEAGIRPFSTYAGVVFERNFNSSDPVDTMTATDGAVSTLYARDFFSARALLGGSENAGN